jgi:hypothetical protein
MNASTSINGRLPTARVLGHPTGYQESWCAVASAYIMIPLLGTSRSAAGCASDPQPWLGAMTVQRRPFVCGTRRSAISCHTSISEWLKHFISRVYLEEHPFRSWQAGRQANGHNRGQISLMYGLYALPPNCRSATAKLLLRWPNGARKLNRTTCFRLTPCTRQCL